MKEDNVALDKALSSGDTDLGTYILLSVNILSFTHGSLLIGCSLRCTTTVYHVLLHLKSRIALGDFFRIVDDRPTAAALLEIYAKEQDRAMLKDFYYQDDRRIENAGLAMEDAATTNVRVLVLSGVSIIPFS